MKYNLPTKNITNYLPKIVSFVLLAALNIIFLSDAQAQTRPYDNTEINLVNKGGLQSDTYYSRTNFDMGHQRKINTLFRYGLTDNMELQVGWLEATYRFQNNKSTSDGTSIGMKFHLTNDGSILPALSAIVSTNLTFDTDHRSFLPSLNILFEKSISSSLNVNGNIKIGLDENSGDTNTNYSLNLEADITNWQTTYIGIKGISNQFRGEGDKYVDYLEVGMLFYVYDRIVLYPFYDIGLNDSSGDIFNIGVLLTLGK